MICTLFTKYNYSDHTKDYDICGICSSPDKGKKCIQNCTQKSEGKKI